MRKLLFLISIFLFLFSCSENKSKNPSKQKSNDKVSEIKVFTNEPNKFQIFPKDESNFDKSLVKFIEDFKKCISEKDTTFLYNTIDDSIAVSYGGGMYGKQDFIENWDLEDFKTSKIWAVFENLLKFGGTVENDDEFGEIYSIPYYQSGKFFKKLKYGFDWYFTGICISKGVKIYERPSDKSKVIAELNYEIIELVPESKYSNFPKIKILSQNKIGFVKENQIMLSSEQTIILKKKNNSWKIVSFAPFD